MIFLSILGEAALASRIDLSLSLYAIGAFVTIGLSLALMILFVKAKCVRSEECQLTINDDKKLTVLGGGTLLEALTSNGIPVPSPCGGKATCKQCRVHVLEGGGEALETEKATFTKKQINEGLRLSCQCKVRQDMKIHVEEHLMGVKTYRGRVISNENVATFIKELAVEVPEAINYKSGGYLQIHIPAFKTNTEDWKKTMEERYWSDWNKFNMFGIPIDYSHLKGETIRAYSMASYPAEGKKLLFNVRIATPPFANNGFHTLPWGIASSYTFGLKAGDEIKLSGPYGESFMIHDEREIVFLIGGAGSSFGRSHILHLFKTEHTGRRVTLWYGARSLKENIYQEEYEQLQNEFSNFSYHLVLSEPLPEDLDKGWPKNDPTKTNFLFKAFEEGQLKKMEEPEECLYYVCGPPLHNKSIMKLLEDYGVPRENIVLDDFGS